MNIKWEKNSTVSRLAAEGKIRDEDVIAHCRTDEFPAGAATVRLRNVRDKNPTVTVHIRGKSRQRPYWNGGTYECASTCRVNFGGSWQGKPNTVMDSNGELDENLNWLDVHNVVTKVKEAMEV
tara:strand:+ start:1257 stop:1625 length:369 start_codon:yes stop_codon:yes gene_type:complete